MDHDLSWQASEAKNMTDSFLLQFEQKNTMRNLVWIENQFITVSQHLRSDMWHQQI
jgi:hypothetical protein